MPAIDLTFTSNGSYANFTGSLEPAGATGYTFSGTLTAECPLDRSGETFENMVRLSHGGTSKPFIDQELNLAPGINTFNNITGNGERAANETVDFRVGINDGLSGQYSDTKITVIAGGPWQPIAPFYTVTDANGNITYDVRLVDGKARSDGPTGYVIQGTLDGRYNTGTLLYQYATIGHKASNGTAHYVTFRITKEGTENQLKIVGTRQTGQNIKIRLGATSQLLNLYGYGTEIESALPLLF